MEKQVNLFQFIQKNYLGFLIFSLNEFKNFFISFILFKNNFRNRKVINAY